MTQFENVFFVRFEESSCSVDNGNSPLKGGKSKKLRDSTLSSASAGHSKGGSTVHGKDNLPQLGIVTLESEHVLLICSFYYKK